MFPNAQTRRYVIGTGVCMVLYAASIALAEVLEGTGAPFAVTLAVALLPSLAIAGQLLVTLRLIADADEFVRALTAKRFIVAAAVAFMLATTWGFLETYADAPHLPAWLVYPAFWGAFGLVSPFIRTSR